MQRQPERARSAATIFVQCRDMDASLAERLAAYSRHAVTPVASEPMRDARATRMVTRLATSGAGTDAPQPGDADAALRRAGRDRAAGQPRRPAARRAAGDRRSTAATGVRGAASRSARRLQVQGEHRGEQASTQLVAIMPERQKLHASNSKHDGESRRDSGRRDRISTTAMRSRSGYSRSGSGPEVATAQLTAIEPHAARLIRARRTPGCCRSRRPSMVGRDGSVKARIVDPDPLTHGGEG